ncbi:hypothetical protein OEA41_002943 [Lepraria neglecta]|uniref:Uncharacterized protein n=1 Tax=Lepraria neglecta TaxID=209136 RepID=A0AAE0DIG6_9LECA|nr:hypothetical protein OEA41_002943 [Lepraria neglecta]
MSNCGTFAFIEVGDITGTWYQILHRFDVDPCPARSIKCTFDRCRINDSVIKLEETEGASISLKLIKFYRNGFYESGDDPTASLQGIAIYSSHMVNADRFLLLGSNDEKMRLLHVPNNGQAPEIVPFSLTFAEALTRLEKEWGKQLKLKEVGKKQITESES